MDEKPLIDMHYVVDIMKVQSSVLNPIGPAIVIKMVAHSISSGLALFNLLSSLL